LCKKLHQFIILDGIHYPQFLFLLSPLLSSTAESHIPLFYQILRTLVSPGNPAQVTASCQRALHASGILEALCHMLMAGGVPVDTLTETICALAEAIRGNHGNQQYFATVMAPSTPPRYPTAEYSIRYRISNNFKCWKKRQKIREKSNMYVC
jgi:hypothetical protein